MALFDKFKSLIDSHTAVKAVGADPFSVKMERVLSPTEAIIEGRNTILVGTNNYLGLTFDDASVGAAVAGASVAGAAVSVAAAGAQEANNSPNTTKMQNTFRFIVILLLQVSSCF